MNGMNEFVGSASDVREGNAFATLQLLKSFRTTVHQSALVHVEHSGVAGSVSEVAGYETNFQVALPYFGVFAYTTGRRSWLIDANRVFFASPGWEFFEHHPQAIGHTAVLVNPSRELLEEICGSPGPNKSSAFMDASRPATMRLRLLTHQILRLGTSPVEPLLKDEWVIHTLHEAMRISGRPKSISSRAVGRAKEFLHAHSGERLSLEQISRHVGVSPVYLTQEFKRSEGIPLYRYQMQLRLTRALSDLPDCVDITGLALDLGFSSHSHFTSVFRHEFGLTPSEYRLTIGSERLLVANRFRFEAHKRRHA